jgi:hypothetical protein
MKKTLLALSMLAALPALAQRAAAEAARPQRVTVMELEEDLIEGAADRPDAEPIVATHRAQQESMVRVREEFRDKAMQSVGEL